MRNPPAHDPFGRPVRLPVDFSREHRIALVAEAFEAWLAGRQPSDAARLFTAGGAAAWLSQGGDLLRDFWRISAPAGSHRTPAAVKRELCRSSRGTTTNAGADTIDANDLEGTP